MLSLLCEHPDAEKIFAMSKRYRIQFPASDTEKLGQDEIFFTLIEDGEAKRLRFHDYDEIYKRPGLYEQLFYERLGCNSPEKVADLLHSALNSVREPVTELRVIDLGAGNGMMGEVFKREGVARLVGADIIPEAREAAFRDRSTVYDDYYIEDFASLDADVLDRRRVNAIARRCTSPSVARCDDNSTRTEQRKGDRQHR